MCWAESDQCFAGQIVHCSQSPVWSASILRLAVLCVPCKYGRIKPRRIKQNKVAGLRLVVGCYDQGMRAKLFFVRLPDAWAAVSSGVFSGLTYPYNLSCFYLFSS